jgi:tetratricopeptide (TPR) repeat protein
MRPLIVAFVFAGIEAIAVPAIAKQPASPAQKPAEAVTGEEASQRFQRGVTLYRERSYDAALAEFNRAYELAPDYRVLYNVGQVQAERGDYVAAARAFRQYLKDGGSAISESRLTEVQAELTRLEGRIAKVHVEANVEGAELVIDGELAGILPLAAIPVNAGIRHVLVRKKGYESKELRLTLTGGENKMVDVVLKSEQDNTQQSPKRLHAKGNTADQNVPSPQAKTPVNTGFWISLAVTAVAAGATTGFALETNSAKTKFNDELARYPGSLAEIDSKRSDMKRFALITDACGILTVLGVGATVYFAATGWSHPEPGPKTGKVTWQTGPLGMNHPGIGWQVSSQF